MPLGGDYGVLPPVPLNRPASAIGWAYVEPGRHGAAPGFAPPFQPAGVPQHLRRPASTVPEDAEVLAVMARTAATYKDTQQPRPRGLPPSVPEETGWGGGAQGSGPVVSSRLGNSGGSSGNLSSRSAQYGMLVPPGAGPSAAAADASARPASASSLVYEARAKEAEQLYGDRACDMPAQRAFRGCFAPMAAACAPPRGAKEDGEEEEEEEEEPHHQGGGGATLHDSLSSIASFFGVGGGEGNPQQTAAALNAAARRAAFLANVEKKKATQQHQGQGPRGRQAVDPVAAAASYLGDTQAASRYVYQAQQQQQQQQVPLKTGEEDFTQGELDWQQQQWQQAQGQGQYPAADDGAAWRARLGDGGEAGPPQVTSAGSFGAGVYAAPRGPGR